MLFVRAVAEVVEVGAEGIAEDLVERSPQTLAVPSA